MLEEKIKTYEMFAADPQNTRRLHEEEEHTFRSKFERDRDRIIYYAKENICSLKQF